MATKTKSPKSNKTAAAVPSKCKFYIADDVRVEQGGKPSLLGFYPDNVIVLLMPKKAKNPTKENPIGIGGLAIFAHIVGTNGTYDIKLDLFGPDGSSLMKSDGGQLSSETESINFISRFQPMPIVGFGQYKVVLKLNKKPFTTTFEARRLDVNQSAQQQMVFQPLNVKKAKVNVNVKENSN